MRRRVLLLMRGFPSELPNNKAVVTHHRQAKPTHLGERTATVVMKKDILLEIVLLKLDQILEVEVVRDYNFLEETMVQEEELIGVSKNKLVLTAELVL